MLHYCLNTTYGNRYLLMHGIGLVILNERNVKKSIMEKDQKKPTISVWISILIVMDLNWRIDEKAVRAAWCEQE